MKRDSTQESSATDTWWRHLANFNTGHCFRCKLQACVSFKKYSNLIRLYTQLDSDVISCSTSMPTVCAVIMLWGKHRDFDIKSVHCWGLYYIKRNMVTVPSEKFFVWFHTVHHVAPRYGDCHDNHRLLTSLQPMYVYVTVQLTAVCSGSLLHKI